MIAALVTDLAAMLRILPQARSRSVDADAVLTRQTVAFVSLVLEQTTPSTLPDWGARMADLREAALRVERVLQGSGRGASLLLKWRVRRLRLAAWDAVCADLAFSLNASLRATQGDPLPQQEVEAEMAARARRYGRVQSLCASVDVSPPGLAAARAARRPHRRHLPPSR